MLRTRAAHCSTPNAVMVGSSNAGATGRVRQAIARRASSRWRSRSASIAAAAARQVAMAASATLDSSDSIAGLGSAYTPAQRSGALLLQALLRMNTSTSMTGSAGRILRRGRGSSG